MNMNANERFNSFLERSRETDAYWAEKAILEFTEKAIDQMEANRISRSELAKRLGKKPAFVTKLLRGDNNFTFDTACRICRALDMEFVPCFKPQGWQGHWFTSCHNNEKGSSKPLGAKKQEYNPPVKLQEGVEHETFPLAS